MRVSYSQVLNAQYCKLIKAVNIHNNNFPESIKLLSSKVIYLVLFSSLCPLYTLVAHNEQVCHIVEIRCQSCREVQVSSFHHTVLFSV